MDFLSPWLSLGRVSNLPTCYTNVMVGWLIAMNTMESHFRGHHSELLSIVLLLVAATCYYVAGMALNDFVDLERDKKARSFRPIASGKISKRAAGVFILVLIAIASVATFAIGKQTGMVGLALLFSIVLYDVLHGKYGPSLFFMGLCRGLLYLLGAVAVWEHANTGLPLMSMVNLSGILWPMAGLTIYTILVTWIARFEDKGVKVVTVKVKVLAYLAPLFPLLGAMQWHLSVNQETNIIKSFLVGALIWLAWSVFSIRHLLASPPRWVHAIMAFLAGMCLIDLMLVILLVNKAAVLAAVACFILTIQAQRKILGS